MTSTAKKIMDEIEFFQNYIKPKKKSRKKSKVKEKKKQIHKSRPVILTDNSKDQFKYLEFLISKNALEYLDHFMKNIHPDLHILDKSKALYIMACLYSNIYKIQREYQSYLQLQLELLKTMRKSVYKNNPNINKEFAMKELERLSKLFY